MEELPMDLSTRPTDTQTVPLAPTGRLSISASTGRWSWSDGVYALHGMEPGDVVPTAELFLRHVHADDRPLVEHVLDLGREQPVGCEYRLTDLAGKTRTVTLAVDGLPDGTVTGLLVDVTTSRKRAVAAGVNAQLGLALESRSVIDQAKGVVMSTCGVDSELAFQCLAVISQHRNIRLRAIAEEIRTAAAGRGGLDGTLRAQVEATLDVLTARALSQTPVADAGQRSA
jgi:hypothetical protein